MRSFVLTSVLLLGAAIAGAQAIPPAQQAPPNSQIPAEPGTPATTPPTFPRTQQLPPEQPDAPAQKPDQVAPQNSRVAASTPLTIEGCLEGSGGNFTLTDESRGTFQLIGAGRQLRQHVGHTVRVTGTTLNASGVANEPGVSAKPEQEENETTAEANPSPDNGQQTLKVSTVKMMANTCNDVPQR